jgi:riboflavin transporter FmnP
MSQAKWNVATMTKISVLSAIATVLMLLDFPLPVFPSFLKMDASDLAALLAGFSMGPLAGVIVEAVKNILHMVLRGLGDTGGIGNLANFIVGIGWVVPAAWYYQTHKDHKGAIVGMGIGAVSMTVIAALGNWLIFLPLYSKFLFPLDAIISMSHEAIPGVTDMKTLILFAFVPFNLLKSVVISLIAAFIYKPLSPLLHK